MIVIATLFCPLQFQTDELANGRFKLNQWQYLHYYKMSELSSIRDRPVNFCGEDVVLIRDFPL